MRFTPFAFLGQAFIVDYLIVGGGGRGGTLPNAHGGGGGGVVSGSVETYQGDVFNIIVGAGATSASLSAQTSSLEIKSSTLTYASGAFDGLSGNGFASGSSISCAALTVAGGGGSSALVGNQGICNPFPTQTPGNGGDGATWIYGAANTPINGNNYGGGGGAGNSSPVGITKGLGGTGGGGNGGYIDQGSGNIPTAAQNGLNIFGGGGGGQGAAGGFPPGDGGSGSVIIRYPSPQKAYGGNIIFDSGDYVYHTFTSNGTLTT